MRKPHGVWIIAFGLLVSVAPALAHHPLVSVFDLNKMVTVKGVVRRLEWKNPHVHFYLNVTEQNGNQTPWEFESYPPAALKNSGLTKQMLLKQASTGPVTIEAYRAKDGTNFGWIHRMDFADGRTLIFPQDQQEGARFPPPDELKRLASMPAPRTADGHPDLNGYWGPRPPVTPASTVSADGKTITLRSPNPSQIGQGSLSRLQNVAADRAAGLRPTYKPEYQPMVEAMMRRDVAFFDPTYRCQPYGVPRIGAPWEIVQVPGTILFIYGNTTEGLRVRVIPTDGRRHAEDTDARPMGDSRGTWEGDTLVVDVTHLDDTTWLDGDGTFHSSDLHVVERLTRQGNTIQYEILMEDPAVLAEPWRKRETLILTPGKHPVEGHPCVDHGSEHHGLYNDRQGNAMDPETIKNLPPTTPYGPPDQR